MKKRLHQISIASMVLIAAGLSFNSWAADGYKPAVSFPKGITSFTIHQDGSYELIAENLRRVETEAGISISGDADITYIPRLESVQVLEAYTILPDGRHVKVPQKNIRTTNDDLERGGASYSDAKHKIIIFPDVAVGGQVYWKYKKVVHTPDYPNQFEYTKFISPQFKHEHREVNFEYDPRIDIKFDSKGFEGGRQPDSHGMRRYSFVRRQETALPPEPDAVDETDYAPFVQATTYPNYEALGAAYQAKAKPQVRLTPDIRKLADELTTGVEDKKAQTRILYGWVAKNIRYVGSYIGNGGFVPHDSQSILDNKWGDCKDHVVLLEALLAAKGVDSSPALINTKDSYVLPRLPANVFNHVITYVPSLNMYLDSTANFVPFGELPEQDLDKQVILTGLNSIGRTPPMKADKQKVTSTILLKILSDGSIQGTSHSSASGGPEIAHRSLRFSTKDEPQKEVVNARLNANRLTGVGQLSSTDPTDIDTPYVENSTFTLDPISRFPGPGALFIPAGMAVGVIDRSNEPKPKDKLTYPMRCDSFSYSNHFEIEFPTGIKIKSIPDNVNYKDGATQYTATYLLNGNKLEISREVIVQHPTMVCGVAENEMDKKFFTVFQRDMLAQVIYE